MYAEVVNALEAATKAGLLERDLPYGKSQIVAAMIGANGFERAQAEHLFSRFRKAVSTDAELAPFRVHAHGERRGRKYVLNGIPSVCGQRPMPSRQPAPQRPGSRRPQPPVQGVPSASTTGKLEIHLGDNLPILESFPDASFDLIYIDPPFNTGKVQSRTRVRTVRDEAGGDRVGFGGRRYKTIRVGSSGFADDFDDFLSFLQPRLLQARRLLSETGSFFLHIDYREVHYCKILLDEIFGRGSFINEIVWAYDYGGRSKKKWSAKHDNILWYAKNPRHYTFNFDEMDRIPYMAPGLVGKEKAARGKTPTDVWWHTIVPTNGRERTGYATQKPLGILQRIMKVHSRRGDRVLDFFAGSGTTGEAAVRLGRSAVLVDSNEEAMRVMANRLSFAEPRFWGYTQTTKPVLVAEPGPKPASRNTLFSGV